MNGREQMRRVCEQNRTLARENTRLREELRELKQECRELIDANLNLRVEVEACDVVLGEAMDELLSGGKS